MRRVQLGGVSTRRSVDDQDDHLLLSLTDISDRHRLQQQLEAANQEREQLIEAIPVGVYRYRMLAGGGTRFDYVSPLWCQQLDLDRDAVLADGDAATARIHPDDHTSFVAANAAARKSGRPFRWEGRFLVRGEVRWFRLGSTPEQLANGDILWNGIQEDITQRKLAEVAVREGQEAFISIVETSLDGFICTDSGGRLTDVNNT